MRVHRVLSVEHVTGVPAMDERRKTGCRCGPLVAIVLLLASAHERVTGTSLQAIELTQPDLPQSLLVLDPSGPDRSGSQAEGGRRQPAGTEQEESWRRCLPSALEGAGIGASIGVLLGGTLSAVSYLAADGGRTRIGLAQSFFIMMGLGAFGGGVAGWYYCRWTTAGSTL